MTALPPAAILTDIEATITPLAFRRDKLLPFARARLADCVAAWATRPAVAAELAEVRRLAPGAPELATLLQWMEHDARVPPLLALQRMIWREGYEQGSLRGAVYPDVAPSLRRWAAAGLRLYVYAPAPVEAQKLLFGHATAGDLTGLFAGFFDTRVGGMREPDSYGRLAIGMNVPTVEVLFLSAVEDELDAAAAAGMRTCQLVREGDGTEPSDRHAVAADFPGVADRIGLPRAVVG